MAGTFRDHPPPKLKRPTIRWNTAEPLEVRAGERFTFTALFDGEQPVTATVTVENMEYGPRIVLAPRGGADLAGEQPGDYEVRPKEDA